MSERRAALRTIVRGYPFVVYAPFKGSIRVDPTYLVLNGHSLTDDELARGYWDEREHGT